MITVITGLTGSGKTWLMSKILYNEWKRGAKVYSNFRLNFSTENEDIFRWRQLDETYRLTTGLIAIDEGQMLFDARRWQSLPTGFLEKISQHRKHHINIITTTQDLVQIDSRIRCNIHVLKHCKMIFRFPMNESAEPWLQLTRVTTKTRETTVDTERLMWKVVNRKFYFISKFFSKKLYYTFDTIGLELFVCKLETQNGKTTLKIYDRQLVNSGKARL